MAREKLKTVAGKLHRHGCVQCSGRYDDACGTPETNGRCHQCVTDHAYDLPVWVRNYAPIDCCRRNSVQASNDLRNRYSLAGPGPWWICRTCARTHPFNPTLTKEIL